MGESGTRRFQRALGGGGKGGFIKGQPRGNTWTESGAAG